MRLNFAPVDSNQVRHVARLARLALDDGAEDVAVEVDETEKLQGVFGTDEPVEEGRLYGDLDAGTARIFHQPVTTHPGDHLNSQAIGQAVEWMQTTLEGAETDLDPYSHIWQWNEIGRLIALVGMVVAMLGFGGLLLTTGFFVDMIRPLPTGNVAQGPVRILTYVLIMFVPIITYYWLQNQAEVIFELPTPLFPQNITTGIMVWAVGNGLITLVLFLIWHFTSNRDLERPAASYGLALSGGRILKALLLAVLVVGFAYALLLLVYEIFKVDFRFWVVAVKPMSALHFRIFLGYLPFFLFFFLLRGMRGSGTGSGTLIDPETGEVVEGSADEPIRSSGIFTPGGGVLNEVFGRPQEALVQIGARPSENERIEGRTSDPGLIFAECDAFPLADPGRLFDTDNLTVFWSWFASTPALAREHLGAIHTSPRALSP